jgi:hypothetical protein
MTSANLPPIVFGINTVLLMGVANPLYRFVVKPLNTLLSNYMKYKKDIAAKVSDIEAINKTSSIEQAVLSETVKDEDGDIEQHTINTPVTVPVVKPVEQKANIVDF